MADDKVKKDVPEKAKSEGAEIAQAIAEGLKAVTDEAKKEKTFVFEPEVGVQHRFSLVKGKDGQIYTRENEDGKLTPLQLYSIEEKEAMTQSQDTIEL